MGLSPILGRGIAKPVNKYSTQTPACEMGLETMRKVFAVAAVFGDRRYKPILRGYNIFERLDKFFGSDNFVNVAAIGKKGPLTLTRCYVSFLRRRLRWP